MIEPKTDWTPIDRYNYTDFNRVLYNTRYIADTLAAQGYVIPITVINDVTRTNFPLVSLVNNARQNLIMIMNNYYWPANVTLATNPARKQMFGDKEANELEIAIREINGLMASMIKSYRLCGTFSCGEEVVL